MITFRASAAGCGNRPVIDLYTQLDFDGLAEGRRQQQQQQQRSGTLRSMMLLTDALRRTI
jgi:hypothetical protein